MSKCIFCEKYAPFVRFFLQAPPIAIKNTYSVCEDHAYRFLVWNDSCENVEFKNSEKEVRCE